MLRLFIFRWLFLSFGLSWPLLFLAAPASASCVGLTENIPNSKVRVHTKTVCDHYLKLSLSDDFSTQEILEATGYGATGDLSKLRLKANKREDALYELEVKFRTLVTADLSSRISAASADGQDNAKNIGIAGQYAGEAQRDVSQGLRSLPYEIKRAETRKSSSNLSIWKKQTAALVRLEVMRWAAAEEVLAALDPIVFYEIKMLPDNGPKARWARRQTQRSAKFLGDLADYLAAIDPANPIVPPDLDSSHVTEAEQIYQNIFYEEFLGAATHAPFYNPHTRTLISGLVREEIAANAKQNLAEYLAHAVKHDTPSTIFGLHWFDSRPNLATDLKARLGTLPNHVYGLLAAGVEPSPKEFFLAVALALNRERDLALDNYNKNYLGEGWWETGLGRVLRSTGTMGDESLANVQARLAGYDNAVALLVDVFTRAANTQRPEELPELYQELLEDFGYLVSIDNERTGAPEKIFRIRGGSGGLGHYWSGRQRKLDIPGASVLDVINPKSVITTVATIVLPELMMAGIGAKGGVLAETAPVIERMLLDIGTGALVDVGLEYTEQKIVKGELTDEDHRKIWEKIALESIVLGGLTHVSGLAAAKVSDGLINHMVMTPDLTRAGNYLREQILSNEKRRDAFYKFVESGLGVTSESLVAAGFQTTIQGQNVDINTFLGMMLSGAMTRAVGYGTGDFETRLRAYVNSGKAPPIVKHIYEGYPELSGDVMKNQAQNLERHQDLLTKFNELNQQWGNTGESLFYHVLEGELTFSEVKDLYTAGQIPEAEMVRFSSDLRTKYNRSINDMARREAIKMIRSEFDREIALVLKADGPGAEAQATDLKNRSEVEIDFVMLGTDARTGVRDPDAPGSAGPTSDIDQSALSPYLRKALVTLYNIESYALTGRPVPTSARAFDVNQYINVFPFIAETGHMAKKMKDLRFSLDQGGEDWGHAEYTEAVSLSASMKFMKDWQVERFFKNKRAEILSRGGADEEISASLQRLNKMKRFAEESLQETAERIRHYEAEIAADPTAYFGKKGYPDNPEVATANALEVGRRAREELYNERMMEVRKEEWELARLESEFGRESEGALAKRAEITRMMSIAMRDGIETYSHIVGIDMVVNRVQSKKKLVEIDGKITEKKMTILDRLGQPDFNLNGELSDYSVSDMNGVLNDQVMFTIEHVNGFNEGHEGSYKTGRALGKYLTRAFLAMKAKGMDLGEVMARPATDPTRQLFEISKELLASKNNPEGLKKALSNLARRQPYGPENGLAEVFFLIEQVIPGLQGLTGVIPNRSADGALVRSYAGISGTGDRPRYRRARMLDHVRRIKSESTAEGLKWAAGLVSYLEDASAKAREGLSAAEKVRQAMVDLASEEMSRDWSKYNRFAGEERGAELVLQSLPWPGLSSDLYRQLSRTRDRARNARIAAYETKVPFDAAATLSNDPYSYDYHRIENQVAYYRDLIADLNIRLEVAREDAAREAAYDNTDISGEWECGIQPNMDGHLIVSLDGDSAAMTLSWDGKGEQVDTIIEGRYGPGIVRGIWTSQTARTKPYGDIDVPDAPVRMPFEAQFEPDAKELRFENTFAHPAVDTEWHVIRCKRRGGGPSGPQEFIQTAMGEPDGEPPYGLTIEDVGKIKLRVVGADGEELYLPHRIFRLNRPTDGGPWLTPGQYRLVIDLGGRTHTEIFDIAAGAMSEVTMRPGGVRITLSGPGGPIARGVIQIFDVPDSSTTAFSYILPEDGVIHLPPGTYKINVQHNGSLWMEDVEVSAGALTEAAFSLGRLNINGPDNITAVRLYAGSSGASRQPVPAVLYESFQGSSASLSLPPGEYFGEFMFGKRIIQRRFKIELGTDTSLSLR